MYWLVAFGCPKLVPGKLLALNLNWEQAPVQIPILLKKAVHLKMLAHYSDVKMSAMASQIIGVSIVYSTISSGAEKRKQYSSA